MITAKDIHKKRFEKVKFGYSPEEVDSFLSQIESDLRLMEQEAANSNNKVLTLAEEIRKYRESEEDLKNALIGAQRQAREVVEEARATAAQIEADARAEVTAIQENAIAEQEAQLQRISAQLEQENRALVATQRQVAAFKKALFDMYKAHLEQISKLPETTEDMEELIGGGAEPAPAPLEDPVTEAAEACVAEQPTEPEAETPAFDEGVSRTRSPKQERSDFESRFENLQFGSRRDDKKKRS